MQGILQTTWGIPKNATSVKCDTGLNQLDIEIKRSKVKVTARPQMPPEFRGSLGWPHISYANMQWYS